MRRSLLLLVSLSLALSACGGDDADPPSTSVVDAAPTTATEIAQTTEVTATTEVTTTTIPDALDPQVEEGLAVATAFVEALIAGDLATAEGLALASVPLFLVDGGGSPGVGPMGEVPWKDALGWVATLDECVLTSPDPVDTRVTCSVTNSTDISIAVGVGPYTGLHQYTVMYEGGTFFGQTIEATTVVSSGGDADTWGKVGYEEFKAEAFDPFMAWLQTNHLDDLEGVMWHAFSLGVSSPDRWLTGDFGPDHRPESIELWRQYSEEFLAEPSG